MGEANRHRKYKTLYERLVSNTKLEYEENYNSCWLWTGFSPVRGYPQVSIRTGKEYPESFTASRVMLEILTGFEFPFDEAGHRCFNTHCLNPDHISIETPAENKASRRGYTVHSEARWIPVLYPLLDPLQEAANRAYDSKGTLGQPCPF